MKITVTNNFNKINKSATVGSSKKNIIISKKITTNPPKKGCGGCSRRHG